MGSLQYRVKSVKAFGILNFFVIDAPTIIAGERTRKRWSMVLGEIF